MDLLNNYNFKGISLKVSAKKLIRTSDGDTPQIEQAIRMVSCDTPEKSVYAGSIEKSQEKLDITKERLKDGFYNDLDDGLRDYLIKKLGGKAAEKHIEAGEQASMVFEKILEKRLTKPNGTKRKVAVIPTGEIIDNYGRMLAYLAPWFSGEKSDPLPDIGSTERQTFNLNMIENGWAAFFPIYPSLPKKEDFILAINAAKNAWNKKKGVWELYGESFLLGYEFRMCIKLSQAKSANKGIKDAFQRICIDLRGMKNCGKYDFYKIDPCYRLWIWDKDLKMATADLGII